MPTREQKLANIKAGLDKARTTGQAIRQSLKNITPQTTVSSYKDNPNGTTTNFLANGQQDTGSYTKNSDGTLTFHPQSTPTATPSSSDVLMSEITKRIANNAGASSSSSTKLQDSLAKAAEYAKTGASSGADAINLSIDNQIANTQKTGLDSLTAFRESGRGFARNNAALAQIKTDTQKRVDMLETKRREALAGGQSQLATQLAGLQIKSIQFEMQAQQQNFDNLMSAGNLGMGIQRMQLQVKQEARLQTSAELSNKLSQDKFNFLKISSAADQNQAQIRINIMSRELKLKELAQGGNLTPDAGFATVDIQNTLGARANALLAGITTEMDTMQQTTGRPPTDAQHTAAIVGAYMKLRNEATNSQADNQALAGLLGLKVANSGELVSMAQTSSTTQLPGEPGAFSNFIQTLKADFSGQMKYQAEYDKLTAKMNSGQTLTPTENKRRDRILKANGYLK